MKMRVIILITIFCSITLLSYNQTYTSFIVQKIEKSGISKPIQTSNDIGSIDLDTLHEVISIMASNGQIIIEGHSMKKLSENKYRFHKYNKENSDFEIELFKDSAILYTQQALLFNGYKFKTIFQTNNSNLLSDKK